MELKERLELIIKELKEINGKFYMQLNNTEIARIRLMIHDLNKTLEEL